MTNSKYRNNLPQTKGTRLLTDSGLETTLVFHDEMDLPCFAAFPLLDTPEGRKRLDRYYRQHADIAAERNVGFVLEAPTWRASRDWGAQLDYDPQKLADVNRASIEFLSKIRDDYDRPQRPFIVSGNLGPRGDGYVTGEIMSADEAEAYHSEQIETFADTVADMISAFTLTYAEEAIGIANAARKAGIPSAISFTLETDGRLPSGQSLADAIRTVDAETGGAPAYFMINCAHPTHFAGTVAENADWLDRIQGLRANASKMSHAELDCCETLDDGNPAELGQEYRELLHSLTNLTVLGGCCGTDHRHIEAISHACCPKIAA